MKTASNIGEVGILRIQQVRPSLQIARVLRGLAIHQARMCRRNKVGRSTLLSYFANELLQRRSEFFEADEIFQQFAGRGDGERFVVREKIARTREMIFGDLVVAAVNGIVRT